MRVLDLFSGIGGFSLGLERAGMQTVAFCEIDPYARAVLAKHWPGVPCYEDIRALNSERLSADGIPVDVVCGGFPCQDISLAGLGAGLAGARSGLWHEMHRIIAETRPRFVIAENVSALRSRGLDVVLGSLAAIGYDAAWHCIPASAVGAPHRRDRVWIIAYPASCGCEQGRLHTAGDRAEGSQGSNDKSGHARQDVDHAECIGWDTGWDDHLEHDGQQLGATSQHASNVANTNGEQHKGGRYEDEGPPSQILFELGQSDAWIVEPNVGRVAYGVPARVDRLRSLGNAVVPQIPEMIGHAIMAAENARTAP